MLIEKSTLLKLSDISSSARVGNGKLSAEKKGLFVSALALEQPNGFQCVSQNNGKTLKSLS
jgi:hypothetical protein